MSKTAAELSDTQIASIVGSYRLQMARYEKLADFVSAALRRELRADPVHHLLGTRVKSTESLKKKLESKRRKYQWEFLSTDLNREVTDLAGCRIIVYVPEDVELAARAVERCSLLTEAKHQDAARVHYGPDWAADDRRHRDRYRATHLLVSPHPDAEGTESVNGAICEVQVTTVAALLCNHHEHDVAYKDGGVPPSEVERHLLDMLSIGGRAADLTAAAFHKERKEHLERERRARQEEIPDAYALRYASEKILRRPLRGEFAPLFKFLETTSAGLTHSDVDALLRELPPPDSDSEIDDVTQLFLAITERRPKDVRSWVEGWHAPRSALRKRLKEALDTPKEPR
jgi:ppGpp synthetase/RelA/SpoT-type nucleotidyltranferase